MPDSPRLTARAADDDLISFFPCKTTASRYCEHSDRSRSKKKNQSRSKTIGFKGLCYCIVYAQTASTWHHMTLFWAGLRVLRCRPNYNWWSHFDVPVTRYSKKSSEGRFSNIPQRDKEPKHCEREQNSYSTDSLMRITSHPSLLWLWLSTRKKRKACLICHCQYWPTWIQYVQQWETLFKQNIWRWITSEEAQSARGFERYSSVSRTRQHALRSSKVASDQKLPEWTRGKSSV